MSLEKRLRLAFEFFYICLHRSDVLGFQNAAKFIGDAVEFGSELNLWGKFLKERFAHICEAHWFFFCELHGALRNVRNRECAVSFQQCEFHMAVILSEGDYEIIIHPAPREFGVFSGNLRD